MSVAAYSSKFKTEVGAVNGTAKDSDGVKNNVEECFKDEYFGNDDFDDDYLKTMEDFEDEGFEEEIFIELDDDFEYDEDADDIEEADIFDKYDRAACLAEMAEVHFDHDLTEDSSDEEVKEVYREFQEEMQSVENAMFPNGRVEDADEF